MPNLRSSPRIRSAPHSRFSAARRGRCDAPRDLARQTRRKPCRCQRSRVSGCTMRSAARHPRVRRARRTRWRRSAGASTGRLTWRPRTTSCWRRKAFSTTKAAFVLDRSPAALPMSGPVAGLVVCQQWCERCIVLIHGASRAVCKQGREQEDGAGAANDGGAGAAATPAEGGASADAAADPRADSAQGRQMADGPDERVAEVLSVGGPAVTSRRRRQHAAREQWRQPPGGRRRGAGAAGSIAAPPWQRHPGADLADP